MSTSVDDVILDGLAAIEAARTFSDLPDILQKVADANGFASYAFFDGRTVPTEGGSVITTIDEGWRETYAREGLVHHDPSVFRMLTSSRPFYWSDLGTPPVVGRPTPSQLPLLAARDHGYVEGLVLPLHEDDGQGGRAVSSCAFFVREDAADVRRSLGPRGPAAVGMLAAAWTEKFHSLAGPPTLPPGSSATFSKGLFSGKARLSARETDILNWAARGKTAEETATILGLGRETVQTHLSNAARKLKASNKTHAVALAVHRRLILP